MPRLLSDQSVLEPIDSLVPHPENPNEGDLEAIKESIETNGFLGACIVQLSTRHILVGNHRWQAAKDLGYPSVPVFWVDVTDDEARRIMLVDNRTAERASRDPRKVLALIEGLQVTFGSLVGTGYDGADVARLLATIPDTTLPAIAGDPEIADDTESAAQTRATDILTAAHVTIDEPRHTVRLGQVWRVGPHVLVCGSVFRDWPQYVSYLEPGTVFCPFPGPFVPLIQRLETQRLLLVQPNPYIAGHLLDRMAEQHPDWTIALAPAPLNSEEV